jgi:DNA-binding NarL/FixJ family response regulator
MSHLGVEGPEYLFVAIRANTAEMGRRSVVVADEKAALAALRLAIDGHDLLIHAIADRPTLDRLYDDLRRLGPVEVRTASNPEGEAPLLTDDEVALLALLAGGLTLRDAATEQHLSLRTADRRLASARTKLHVSTTAEAVSAMARQRRSTAGAVIRTAAGARPAKP